MTVPTLAGNRLTLRPPRSPDREAWQALGHSPEVARGFGVALPEAKAATPEEADSWFADFSEHESAWAMEIDGRFIGTVRLHSFVPADRRASIAIAIFDPALLGRGYGTEALELVIRHAFTVLALHRLCIRVLASNSRAVRCYEKCGFEHEGRERESARVGQTWEDDLIMGLVNPAELEQAPAQ